ncbi:endonuclease V N-glycosylase UV repair enzyme [Escherichia phage vB_EcoM_KWBSE43-6]|uniref:Putative pyrimidine dimer DNA glycosylase n=1 Tax=Escherichia phage vB_EcoM_KWBSE43-6 TaxID=2508194 RepID=A0A482N0C0_9CAUD|nr:endonuclease V N-glycosylase UV repair enzyme [Escherichia phage vB_EcoM_KWBSE43-6]QBQ79033.1 putative pyrimidine dimer DNA glycosylase [Escherichia phage vB_EcoM_KWBSE43-6]
MTRINVIPVESLCDQHLLAEYTELAPVVLNVVNGKRRNLKGAPKHYKLNEGHVLFFRDKLIYLIERYDQLVTELISRGYTVNYPSLRNQITHENKQELRIYLNDYQPTQAAVQENVERIVERLKGMGKITYNRKPVDPSYMVGVMKQNFEFGEVAL